MFVLSFWIVGFIGVTKSAMMVHAHHAELVVCINVNVGRERRKGNAVIGIFGVIIHVIGCLGVESISVPKDVIQGNVASAHFKEGGLVLVGNEFMKGCLVTFLCHCVVQLVIRS